MIEETAFGFIDLLCYIIQLDVRMCC